MVLNSLNPTKVSNQLKEEARQLEYIESQMSISPQITMRILTFLCLKDGNIDKAAEFFESALLIDEKIFQDLGIVKTDVISPNITDLIKALRAKDVAINPIMPLDIILYIVKFSNINTLLSLARCSKKLSLMVRFEVRKRFSLW